LVKLAASIQKIPSGASSEYVAGLVEEEEKRDPREFKASEFRLRTRFREKSQRRFAFLNG
jgi:hypothetical protein